MYPVFINLRGKKCVVVGGGSVGERKAKKLAREKADVIVISKSFTAGVIRMGEKGYVKLLQKEYEYGDIPQDTFLVFECVGDRDLARLIETECREKKILFNSASFPEISDFFVPASVKKGGLEIAISTYGRSSSVSRALREKIEDILPRELSRKLMYIGSLRERFKSKGKKTREEDRFLLRVSRILFERPDLSFKSFRSVVQRELRKL